MAKKKPTIEDYREYLRTVGARIRAARLREGLTIQQAADRGGVKRVTWTKWESGENHPNELCVACALDLPRPADWWPLEPEPA